MYNNYDFEYFAIELSKLNMTKRKNNMKFHSLCYSTFDILDAEKVLNRFDIYYSNGTKLSCQDLWFLTYDMFNMNIDFYTALNIYKNEKILEASGC